MKRGDLVEHEGAHWIVQVYDARRLKIALLLKADGTTQEVPHDLDLPVVGNPALEWPFITVPEKPRWGKVIAVSKVTARGLLVLTPFKDWLLSDPVRSGGSLFVRPGQVQTGDILQVQFERGVTNINITPTFGTVAVRQARAVVKKPARPANVYDRLASDDGDFDE